jgi:hypothetical protein
MALEFHGADYHFLQDGDVQKDGLANVKSASLSGDKETEVWGKDGSGEFNALAIGGMKYSGEKTGYASAFEPPVTTGVMDVAGVSLIKKGFRINASVEDFTEMSLTGVGAPGVTPA